MSPRDPTKTQSDAPQLLADLIKELKLIGAPIGLLDFADTILPVFIIGSRGLTVVTEEPVFTDGEQVSNITTGVTAGQIHVDTGQLAAGVFDIIAGFAAERGGNLLNQQIIFEHRNAANTTVLSGWSGVVGDSLESNAVNMGPWKFSFQVAQDERFRIFVTATDANLLLSSWIMFHRRPDVS